MIIPYLSADWMKAQPEIGKFWLDFAVNVDSAMGLDRAIGQNTKHDFFVRPLMKNEMESEIIGKCVHETPGALAEIKQQIDRECATKNARLVYIHDREKGIRFKDFVFVFAMPDMHSVDVEDDHFRWFSRNAKDMSRRCSKFYKQK